MADEAGNGTARRASKPEIQEAEYAHRRHSNDTEFDRALNRARTTGNVSISAELFEKLYLSPKTAVKGDLRATFGNPTPVYVTLRHAHLFLQRLPPSLTCGRWLTKRLVHTAV